MSHAQKISPEVKARAVRMVQEHQEDYPSVTAEIKALEGQGAPTGRGQRDPEGGHDFFVGELDSRTR